MIKKQQYQTHEQILLTTRLTLTIILDLKYFLACYPDQLLIPPNHFISVISLLINNTQLFRKYNKIWDKVSNSIKKELIAKNAIMEKKLKYLRTKRKIYKVKINTNFIIMECVKKSLILFVYQQY